MYMYISFFFLQCEAMESLPDEILLHVFRQLDDKSLIECELVCSKWRSVINEGRIFSKKCSRLRHNNPELVPTFAFRKFDTLIKNNHKAAKEFYFKLKYLKSRWTKNHEPKIYNYYCVTGEVSSEWLEKHNYTGVYDMVWLPEKSLLILSVYDSIQVWNMANNERINTFTGNILDTEKVKSNCFHACAQANVLLTGTNNGVINAFDLFNCKPLGKSEDIRGIDMLCDIKSHGGKVLAIDWRGLIAEFKINRTDTKIQFPMIRKFYPPWGENVDDEIPHKYKLRFSERLIEFNEFLGFTNCTDMVIIFDIEKLVTARWILTKRAVLCVTLFEKDVYWGGGKGIVNCFSNFDTNSKSVETIDIKLIKETFRTNYQDSITSISMASSDKILIGDVNAEIHCLSLPLSKDSLRFTLESGHAYKSYIWALECDASRIFSGDSDACLVVHDYWKDSTDTENESECKKAKYHLGH